MKEERSYIISLYKFLASIFIMIYHFDILYKGSNDIFQHFYIWVEFFFIVSGFFIGKNALDKKVQALDNCKKQIAKLYPMYLMAFFISFGVMCIHKSWGFKESLHNMYNSKWEILMMHVLGFETPSIQINGVTAQIPALIIASLIVWYLIQNHNKFFINLAPIISICLYVFILNKYGNYSQWFAVERFTTIGVIRGYAGVSLGAWSYIFLNDYFEKNKIVRKLVFYVSIIAFGGLVVLREYISFADLTIYIFIFALFVSCSHTNFKNIKSEIFKKVTIKLEKLSYPVFLLHYSICFFMKTFMAELSYGVAVIVYMVISIIIAMILLKLDDFWKRILRNK